MNNGDSYSVGSGKELLDELMPQLGMEAAEPRKKYKNQTKLRYYLPRVLTGLVILAALVFLGSYLLSPAEFYNVVFREGPSSAEATFNVDRVLLLEGVSATLDGQPAAVTWDEVGSYQVSTDKNGELVVTARTFTGRESQTSFTVSAIDTEPPHISGDDLVDGEMYIYFTDGEDGSGIDWSTVKATAADTGESFELGEVNAKEGYVRFPFPDKSVRIYLEDNNGNPLAALLRLLDNEAEQSQPGT